MAKFPFLGKRPRRRKTLVRLGVGVPGLESNEAKNARKIAVGLGEFRTMFENDDEKQQQPDFRGFSDCEVAKFLAHRATTEISNQNAIKAATYDNHGYPNPVSIQPSIVSKMVCEQVKENVNLECESNTENTFAAEVILPEDDLIYTYATSCQGGPFNEEETSGEVQCGVCGVIRFYKSVLKTKKYGAHICDLCRKFIDKCIDKETRIHYIPCNNEKGIGLCRIPIGLNSQNGIAKILSTDSRCKACWLQMCLMRLKLPEKVLEQLIDTLPIKMVPVLLWLLKENDPWTVIVAKKRKNNVLREYKLQKAIVKAYHAEGVCNEISSSEYEEFSDKSDSDADYTTSKEKRLKLREESNSKNQKSKKAEHCRDNQSASLGSTNGVTPDLLETEALPVDSLQSDKADQNQSEKVLSVKKKVAIAKNIPVKYTKLTNSANKEQDYFSSIQRPNRTLQDLLMQDRLNANTESFEVDKTIDLNFRESYDPDRIKENGFAIVGTKPLSLPRQAACFLCGSAGLEKLIHCVSCCEPYHKFCLDGVGVGISSHESEWLKLSWTCPKCKVCKSCKSRGKIRPKLTCQRCKDSYHENCLLDDLIFDPNIPWVCPSCRKCKSCQVPQVDYFVGNLALCAECFQLRQHGNYCPLCQNCYKSDDYESKMMECATCKHWVHAKCEDLSNEKYEILSTLPEIIEYVCKSCTTESTIPWRIYVDDALKSGFLTVLAILGKNKKTCDLIKWSPQKQSPGCVCKKLIVPKFPSLDESKQSSKASFEIPKQCVCHGLEGWSKGTPTLVTIKQKITNNEYESIHQFNDDMLSTIDKFDVPELREEYKKIVTTVFPWFNSEFCKNSPHKSPCSSTTLPIISPPKFIPKLSLNSDIKALQDIMGNDDNNFYLTPKINDTRICQFCNKLGEGLQMREGRLLYCGGNVWAHANCALWSSEVFEEIDGSLQNVQLALSRCKFVRCVVCNEKGASIGCCHRNCVKTYHFQCARKVYCVFNDNKTVYCNNHASGVRCSVKDFTLDRLIYVEQEDLKQKRAESAEIHILIGSLYISSIGHLHPILSDHVESIFPIDFKATRYYWSTKEPFKLILYSWTTKIENYVEKLNLDKLNYTIDHNKQQNENDILDKNCTQDLDINLCASIQVNNLQKCYESLKRKHPINATFDASCWKMDNIDCFPYSNYETDSEYESTIDETSRMELFSNSYKLKSNTIPQLDGIYDTSDNSFELEYEYYKFLKQSGDHPVKCDRCHRTYRTKLSFDKHLVHCDFNFYIDSDSISSDDIDSDDDVSDKKFENNFLQVQVNKENVLQNNVPVTPIQTSPQQQSILISPQQQPIQTSPQHQQPVLISPEQHTQPTVILQPLQNSFIQPPVSDVQYIAINSTSPQSTMPCFQYQSPPTVVVQPPVIDPNTAVLNNSPVNVYVSQSNNLLISSPQQMVVGLDQYNMSSNYTYTESSQVYQPTKPEEPISNQFYVINTIEPTFYDRLFTNYSITPELETNSKISSTQPKVYVNRKLRSTECYDAKENIPNSLVKSINNQTCSVMNAMKNVNPEPWKKQPLKTYPSKQNEDQSILPKKVEVKKILPKCVESHSSPIKNKTLPKSVVDTILLLNHETDHSSMKLANSSLTTKVSNVLPSTLNFQNNSSSSPLVNEKKKPKQSAVNTLKVQPLTKKPEDISTENYHLTSENNGSFNENKLNSSSISKLEKRPSIEQNCNKTGPLVNVKTHSSKVFSNTSKLKKSTNIPSAVENCLKTDNFIDVTKKAINKNNNSFNEFNNSEMVLSKNLQRNKSGGIVSNMQEHSSLLKSPTSLNKNYPVRPWLPISSERKSTVQQLLFEMSSTDGVFSKDRSLVEIWSKLFEAVQVSRAEKELPQLSSSNPFASDITAAIRSLGLSNNFLKYLLEQLSDVQEFVKYKPIHHKGVDVVGPITNDDSNCARTKITVRKNRHDIFSWLASRHRKPPKLVENPVDFGSRRANSLPNEMKYRKMNKVLNSTVGVYRSDIHGRGLFCLRNIEQGEYIIEYTGEVIRSVVCDTREKLYTKKGIDCYMFRIDHNIVVDATMNGNFSRFINHSCEPNCQSKIEIIHGKKHILILAKRKLIQGEELTYDYKFPLEEDKITCHCLSRKCRKYLN